MEKWHGCDRDCFNCPYEDCIAPRKVQESNEAKAHRPRVKYWTVEENELIRKSAGQLSIKDLALKIGVAKTTLRKHIKSIPELNELYKASPNPTKEIAVEYVTTHQGCLIDDVAERVGKTRTATHLMLHQLQRDKKIYIESGTRWKKTRIWTYGQKTERSQAQAVGH